MSMYSCKNCGNNFSGKYCNNCGEKVISESDKSLRHLLSDFFHFIFHFEGSFLHTIKTMFSKPGKLSLDYCDGIRKPYFKPLSLFLLLVILYLLFPFFPGLNQDLVFYKGHYFGLADNKVAEVMQENNWSFEKLSSAFKEKGAKVSKFLLVLLIPLSALVMWLLTFKRKKYFYDHMILAAEFNSLVLLLVFLIMPLVFAGIIIINEAVNGGLINLGDSALTLMVAPFLLLFLVLSVKRFYSYNWLQSVLFAIIFLLAYNYFVMITYKFILFNIVIHTL